MKNSYADKKALVTGGSSGIGFAIAHQLIQESADVWIVARNAERLADALNQLESVRQRSDQIIKSLQIDLTDIDQVNTELSKLIDHTDVPDYLFNIAGFCHPGYIEKISPDIYRETMDANYFGTVNPTQVLLPAMITRGSGHIINVSSVVGYLALFGYAPYAASKYAIRGYTDVLRQEMKPRGIHVSIVFPPDTDTPQFAYENQYKVPETLGIESVAGQTAAMSAADVANYILMKVNRNKYQIFPGSSTRGMYILQSLAMDLTYPIMDLMLKMAMQK